MHTARSLIKTVGILAFGATMLQSHNACSINRKRDFYAETAKKPPQVEKIRKGKKAIRSGRCSLKDSKTLVYSSSKGKKTFHMVVPLYDGNEKPLDISCKSNRTVLLTTEKIAIFPGHDMPDGSRIDTVLSQTLEKPATMGIVGGEIRGNDVYMMTRTGHLWYTNINDPEKILGFKIDEMKIRGPVKMYVHRNVLFIVQNAPARSNFMVAVSPLDENQEITVKPFAYESDMVGNITFTGKHNELELRIGRTTHLIKVKEPGKLSSISIRAGD